MRFSSRELHGEPTAPPRHSFPYALVSFAGSTRSFVESRTWRRPHRFAVSAGLRLGAHAAVRPPANQKVSIVGRWPIQSPPDAGNHTKALTMNTPLATETPTTTGRGGGGGILLISAIVAALGSLLFGFDTAVISGTTEALRHVYAQRQHAWASPCPARCSARWSALCSLAGPADWWGRRPVLAMLAVLFVIRRWAARWRGTGMRCCSSAGWAAWRSAPPRWCARLYHGDRSRQAARAAGGGEPVEHRARHPGGVFLELSRGARPGGRQSQHLALDVRGDDRPPRWPSC